MAKGTQRIPQELQRWIDARKRFHLSHAHVQMARELGMNPRKLGSLANHDQEPWKAPLPIFIERIYQRHFGKAKPDRVLSIEDRVGEIAAKKAKTRARRAAPFLKTTEREGATHRGSILKRTYHRERLLGQHACSTSRRPAKHSSTKRVSAGNIPRCCLTDPPPRPGPSSWAVNSFYR